jgi:hypothetical protein
VWLAAREAGRTLIDGFTAPRCLNNGQAATAAVVVGLLLKLGGRRGGGEQEKVTLLYASLHI